MSYIYYIHDSFICMCYNEECKLLPVCAESSHQGLYSDIQNAFCLLYFFCRLKIISLVSLDHLSKNSVAPAQSVG